MPQTHRKVHTGVQGGLCTQIYMCTHRGFLFRHPDLSHSSSVTGKKKFQLMYKSEESEHPPGFIHRTLSLCLQYKSKCFISREFLYLKMSF